MSAGAAPAAGGEFGLPERVSQGPQFIDSVLPGDFGGWTPGAKLRLANGQVWEVIDGSTASYPLQRSPKVRISRGLLGSFFMSVEGVSQTPRVRRLQ
jgi:hypothetical protein